MTCFSSCWTNTEDEKSPTELQTRRGEQLLVETLRNGVSETEKGLFETGPVTHCSFNQALRELECVFDSWECVVIFSFFLVFTLKEGQASC